MMTDSDKYFSQIRLYLLRDWDPLLVSQRSTYDEELEDEYNGYAREIARMCERGAQSNEILKYLEWAESENMGLSSSNTRAKRTAKLIERYCAEN